LRTISGADTFAILSYDPKAGQTTYLYEAIDASVSRHAQDMEKDSFCNGRLLELVKRSNTIPALLLKNTQGKLGRAMRLLPLFVDGGY